MGLLLVLVACSRSAETSYQLILANASVFDSVTGEVSQNKTLFVQGGKIVAIADSTKQDAKRENAIDVNGKLVAPSFIDVHNHLNFVYGGSDIDPNPENYSAMQSLLTDQYLPHGVTVARSAGGRPSHRVMEGAWVKFNPNYIDYYSVGGALVSLNTHFYNHAFVGDVNDVVSVIEDYHQSGIRHVKLYSLIGEEHLKMAVKTAARLDMNIFGHIENAMISIESANALGLVNFEHAKTLYLNALQHREANTEQEFLDLPPDDNHNWRFREYEIFRLIGPEDERIDTLVDQLASSGASLTPTLHLYAQPIGLNEGQFNIEFHPEDKLDWSGDKLDRARQGYDALAALVFKLYQEGVTLNAGTDTYEPGKAFLSELLLLNDLGIPMRDVLKIASLNGAKSSGLEHHYGSLEIGKRADMIIFEENPLLDSRAILAYKTIIKDGVVWLGLAKLEES